VTWKKVGVILGLTCALGCSGMTRLIVHNDSEQPLKLVVTSQGKEIFNGTIDPRSESPVCCEFGGQPALQAEINGQQMPTTVSKFPSDFVLGSGGGTGHWRWDGRRGSFAMETFSGVGGMFLGYAIAGLLFCLTGVGLSIWLLLRIIKPRYH
jgi:hypothetical protein